MHEHDGPTLPAFAIRDLHAIKIDAALHDGSTVRGCRGAGRSRSGRGHNAARGEIGGDGPNLRITSGARRPREA